MLDKIKRSNWTQYFNGCPGKAKLLDSLNSSQKVSPAVALKNKKEKVMRIPGHSRNERKKSFENWDMVSSNYGQGCVHSPGKK